MYQSVLRDMNFSHTFYFKKKILGTLMSCTSGPGHCVSMRVCVCVCAHRNVFDGSLKRDPRK